MLRQVMLALLVFVAGHAAAADERWPLGRLALPEAAVAMEKAGDGALLRLSDGSYRRVIWDEGGAALEPAAAPERESAPDMLPDGDVVRGEGTIRRAWLAAPTSRYDHAILGDGIEAAELRVETADGETLVYDAPHDTVFEDLTPRLWDLDGDGEAEVWVVRSGPIEGARFEAYTVREGALRLRMATEPIGQGHRWLNPVGMGDFTGAGSLEVALVKTPHIGGILTVYRRDGLALDPVALVPGVSNHSIGSREWGLAGSEISMAMGLRIF